MKAMHGALQRQGIRKRWQARLGRRAELSPRRSDSDKPKCYVLEMFPYPSGRIHMGHVRNYTMGDVIARFRRAQGFNVLHPMGWDAFGLPAENAARDKGVNPRDWTYANIAAMRAELKPMGLVDRLDAANSPPAIRTIIKQQQKLFLDFYKAGFVYRGEADVNWDPVDMTVLANEQVIDGRGWRSGALVERRKLAQWFFKITAFCRRSAGRAGHAGPLAGKSPHHAEELDRPLAKACNSQFDSVERRRSSTSSRRGPTRCSAPALSRCRRIIR